MRTLLAVRVGRGLSGGEVWEISGWRIAVAYGIEAGVFQARARQPTVITLRVAGERARALVPANLLRLAAAAPLAGIVVVADLLSQWLVEAARATGALACMDVEHVLEGGPAAAAKLFSAVADAAARRTPALVPAVPRRR